MKTIFDWEEYKHSIECIDIDGNLVASITEISAGIYLANYTGRDIVDQKLFSNIEAAKTIINARLIEMGYKMLPLDYKVLI